MSDFFDAQILDSTLFYLCDMLEVEIKYYADNRDKFLDLYDGKYLLIHSRSVIGVYDTLALAYETAGKLYKAGTFLIEHCVRQ